MLKGLLFMKEAIKNKTDLFIQNSRTVKSEFIWHHAMTKRLAALLYAQNGREIDCDEILRCRNMIKDNTGAFSGFRGNMELGLAALLSLSENPIELFSETQIVYDILKDLKFRSSDYLAISAFQIASRTQPSDYSGVANRTRAIYDDMKDRHFFYTGHDDYIFSAMLGLSDLDISAAAEKIESIFARLKGEFYSKNSVQSLAQILVLGDVDDSVMNRVFALRDAVRKQKIKLDKTYTLPILGILALVPADIDEMILEINEIQTYLRAQKGFGSFSVAAEELLLFATSFVADEYAKNIENDMMTAALSTSIANIIIAEQAAMIAIICASSASATAAASAST